MADWIEWKGGDMPVSPETVVTVQYEGPMIDAETPVTVTKTRNAEDCRWEWHANGKGADIIRYRIENI